jgi:serine/threonine-protein kinase
VIGEVVGNYRIVSELGRGGMGMVYRAEHVQLGRPAALKMLLPQMSGDPTIVQRFFNEARAASAIDHPGIVEIYDFGRHVDGRAYIVMALLKGESLDHKLLYGAMPPLEGATIVAQVAGALAAAHTRGIVHRDLKPDNIYLVPNELMPNGTQVKLLDFGIAKLADDPTGFKTQTGLMIGTPAYMSPEQCMGRSDLDHRTDLYSLGCILFHVLTGRPPFLSDHGTGVMIAAHMRDPAPHPRSINPNVPDSLAAITMRLLEKDPGARFQTATELRAALVAAGANAPITRSSAPAIDQYGATMVSVGGTLPALPVGGRSPGIVGGTLPALPVGGRSPGIDKQYSGAEAYGATAAASTTHSGSAAQLVSAPPRAKSKLGLWIGVGVGVLAIGGIAVFAAVQAKRDDAPETVATPTPPAPPAPPALPTPAPTLTRPSAAPVPAIPIDAGVTAACADGQVRNDDTHGNCCWREQAWSTAKNRCVGTPSCPVGTIQKAEQCVAIAGVPAKPTAPQPATPAIATPSFQLDAKSFAPNTDVAIRFAGPVASPSAQRTWVAMAEAGKPPSSYASWIFVDDGASVATLKAPTKPGAYEVRVHTDYPAKSFNVVQSVALTVASGTPVAVAPVAQSSVTPRAMQRFTLATTALHLGDKAELRFPAPMQAAKGEQFWVTVVARGTADSTWGTYEYVANGARISKLPLPAAVGDYEVRLHANYPTKTTNVVHRVAIHVD